jgi:hypothetical protein
MTEWKLVPVEPTGRQLDYALAACSKLTPLNVHNVYRAMLAVAPPAPSAEPVNLNDPAVQKRLAAQWGYVPAPSAEPVKVYNPWRESLGNCINGDNYLRATEYLSLIEELDDLYRFRAAAPPDHTALLRQALDALDDMYNGWRYLRESHGDLYGVGWDRAENKASAAIDALRRAMLAAPPAPSAAPPPAAPTGEEEVTRLVRWLTAPSGKGAK